MSKYATTENAEAISECCRRAFLGLQTAQLELRDALVLARDDYDHNADALEQATGALGLLASAVSQQEFRWRDWADARRRNEGR